MLNRTRSWLSLERNLVTVALIVLRSERSRCKKINSVLDSGKAVFIELITVKAFPSDLVAM